MLSKLSFLTLKFNLNSLFTIPFSTFSIFLFAKTLHSPEIYFYVLPSHLKAERFDLNFIRIHCLRILMHLKSSL